MADTQVDNALLWPLSTVEAKQLNSSLRQLDTTNTGWAIYRWWLRSPGYYVDHAAYVSGNGNVDSYGGFVPSVYGVRPAFYLNLDSVLFTSAATGGKSGGSDSAGFGLQRHGMEADPAGQKQRGVRHWHNRDRRKHPHRWIFRSTCGRK